MYNIRIYVYAIEREKERNLHLGSHRHTHCVDRVPFQKSKMIVISFAFAKNENSIFL